VVPRRRLDRRRSAEELVDLLLKAAGAGEWRAVALMLDRVFGKPTEHVVTEARKSQVELAMDELSTEDLEALARQGRHLRALEDEPDGEAAQN
jgi:hypothetical protein